MYERVFLVHPEEHARPAGDGGVVGAAVQGEELREELRGQE